MSKSNDKPLALAGSSPDDGSGFEPIALNHILAALRRQAWIIGLWTLASIVLSVAYVSMAVPLYTASTDIMIDKGTSNVIGTLTVPTDVFQDDSDMMTQVEVLRSEQLARSVAESIGLVDDPTFMASNPSMLGRIIGGVTSVAQSVLPVSRSQAADGPNREAKLIAAAAILRGNLEVERVEKTYVLRLSYTAADRHMANRIAQAYGEAYLNDQLEAKYSATRRASEWLEERLAQLRQQSYDADLAVQNYRNENSLLSSNNQLISEQQLGELNTQLVATRASTAEAKARLDQIRDIIKNGRTDAVVDDALGNATIVNLRQRYLDASRRLSEVERSFGPEHVQAVRLRAEMAEYQSQIFDELGRIAESYESSYNVALRREESLTESLRSVAGENVEANTSSVQLRELEREADAFRNLYNVFLQRYHETLQQQSFPITEARVITPAKPPSRPSYPRVPIILALATVLGAASGVGAAALREHRDRFFRTGSQVRSELGVEFLGSVGNLAQSDPQVDGATSADIWRAGSLNNRAATAPLSPFTETLRNARFAANTYLADRQAKVIGMVSCLPREGKTTLSANFASLLASQDSRVLLIDGDLRNPNLSRSLNSKPTVGLVEAAYGTSPIEDCLVWSPNGKLAVLPVSLTQRVYHSSEILTSSGMANLIERLRGSFDYIVIDLPPLGPVIDARAMANRIDGFIMVVEWGRTSRKLVRNIMADNPALYEKCLGTIFNKGDEARMKLYKTMDSADYYISQYKDYYHLP
ncbi:polysaccharide biosynthesis tyrosine autokinase [Antarcticirhabdus aurantiaca]|uniref:Polysaccharide biosynthesis tyrosine autokinase n=1 Tax=Antarcticirhabdus aurantiaca TaxID=2606717 RepID=A0ACD4NJR0_9HYPH|nr:polysaccharide biosynthesis tyrosine autokinase [Antarcticirhabdus aurantiaca]WAJ27053.1 polysaccharide biosynthesis tyrosine autokinase [Jeongeuplla avenae]